LRLCFGNALPLPLEHHLALELGHRGNLACLSYETLVRGNESTAAAQCPPVTEC
jgi:hypothetical protein